MCYVKRVIIFFGSYIQKSLFQKGYIIFRVLSLSQMIDDDKGEVKAVDVIVGDTLDDLRKQIKDKIPNDPTKTMGLYSLVSVATAAKYDLTTNIDVTDRLTNGAECVIQNIDYRVENSNRQSIIWVPFPNCNIGRKQQRENMHLYKTNISKDWTQFLK